MRLHSKFTNIIYQIFLPPPHFLFKFSENKTSTEFLSLKFVDDVYLLFIVSGTPTTDDVSTLMNDH